jgi:hypothetical protein
MTADRIEIRVVFHPPLPLPSSVWEELYQQVDRSFMLTHEGSVANSVYTCFYWRDPAGRLM